VFNWLSSTIIFPELHSVLGALAVAVAYMLAPGRLGDPDRSHPNIPRLAISAFVLVVFLKELLWDPVNEVGQPFLWDGVSDFFWYLAGTGAMLSVIWARFRRL
jgi:hypothetical protein